MKKDKKELGEKEYYEPGKWIDDQKVERMKKKIEELGEMLSECRKSLGICMNRLQEVSKNG